MGINDADSTEHDHYTELNRIKNEFNSINYTYDFKNGDSFSKTETDTLLDSDSNSIFVFRGHGTVLYNTNNVQIGTGIVLNKSGTTVYTSSYLSSLNLSNMDIMLFISCSTGRGGENANNLPAIAVQQGAKAAIGFEQDISCEAANDFTKFFFQSLKQVYQGEKTIEEDGLRSICKEAAAYAAKNKLSELDKNITKIVFCGDEMSTLN